MEEGTAAVPADLWPEQCPRLEGATIVEVSGISANIGDSPAGATYIAARGELAASFVRWCDAAKARGFRVIAEHTGARARAASLVDGAGGRAYLLLQTQGPDELAGMFRHGVGAPVRLRGPCKVVVPRTRVFDVDRSAIVQGGAFRRERVLEQVETHFGHDFDGDGELDLLVPTASAAQCPGDLMWTVYLSRGGCAHAVGEVGPGELEFFSNSEGVTGPRPLVFTKRSTALGDGGSVTTSVRTTYVFKGAGYVRGAREEQKGLCHHCPVEVCRPGAAGSP